MGVCWLWVLAPENIVCQESCYLLIKIKDDGVKASKYTTQIYQLLAVDLEWVTYCLPAFVPYV